MQNKFKTLFTLALVATAAQATDVTVITPSPVCEPAKTHHFASGVGLTVGLGVTTAGTSGKNGAGGPFSGMTGFKESTPAVAAKPGVLGHPAGAMIPPVGQGGAEQFIEGGVVGVIIPGARGRNDRFIPGGAVRPHRVAGVMGPDGIFIPAQDAEEVPAVADVPPSPAIPAAVNTIGKPNNFIDFTSPTSVKNNSGFAFVGGLFAQHVSPRGFTMGGRWLFGRSGASSTMNYSSGPVLIAMENEQNISISGNDTQAFRLKDKWFTAVIAELGYTAGRMQFYVGPGVAFHRQKLACVNSSGKVAAGITKTVTSPMFAIGTRFAMSKRVSIGFEWQRHIGGKKTWNNVSKIAPEGMQSFGAPTTKMNNNLFLVNMNYVFGGK